MGGIAICSSLDTHTDFRGSLLLGWLGSDARPCDPYDSSAALERGRSERAGAPDRDDVKAACMSVADNIARVREQMAAAARRAGRSPDSVTLMAVSKTFPA